MAAPIPQVTLEQFNTRYRHLHLLHAAVDYWAAQKPDEAVVIDATRGTQLTWWNCSKGRWRSRLERSGRGEGGGKSEGEQQRSHPDSS
jgi:hypothetical protein